MSSSKKILSGVIWSVISNIVNAVYGFIMIPILINYFGKAEYGLIGLATSVNAYMRLMDMGLTSTNVRFFANWMAKGDNTKVRKLFSTCTSFYGFIGLINASVLLIVYFFSDSIFNVTSEQNDILQNLILILCISAFINWFTSCYNQIIQATENVAWTQKRLLITKFLMLFALLGTVWFKLTILQYFFLTVLCNWMILPWVVRKIREVAPMVSFIPRFDKATFKEILPYTLNIFSFSIFSFSYNNLKPVFLGMQSTPESVTDYKVLMGIVGIITSVTGIFLTTLLPSSSKIIAKNDKDGYNRIAYSGTKYLTIFITFCVFGMITIDRDLLVLYVGESYLYLIPALNIFILCLLGNHIQSISSLILGGSNILPLSKMTAISSTLGLLLAWFMIPSYSVMGIAIATVAYTIGQQLFYYLYYLKKVMKIDPWFIIRKILVPVFLYGSIIAVCLWYCPKTDNHWLNIFVYGILYSIIFIIITYFYLNAEDKTFLKQLILKRK